MAVTSVFVELFYRPRSQPCPIHSWKNQTERFLLVCHQSVSSPVTIVFIYMWEIQFCSKLHLLLAQDILSKYL